MVGKGWLWKIWVVLGNSGICGLNKQFGFFVSDIEIRDILEI